MRTILLVLFSFACGIMLAVNQDFVEDEVYSVLDNLTEKWEDFRKNSG
jgi:hypothetical protein